MKYEAEYDLFTMLENDLPRKEAAEELFQKRYSDSLEEKRRLIKEWKKLGYYAHEGRQ